MGRERCLPGGSSVGWRAGGTPIRAHSQKQGRAPGAARRGRTAQLSWGPYTTCPGDLGLPHPHGQGSRGVSQLQGLLAVSWLWIFGAGQGPAASSSRAVGDALLLRLRAGQPGYFAASSCWWPAVTEAAFQPRKQKNNNRKHPQDPLFSSQLEG